MDMDRRGIVWDWDSVIAESEASIAEIAALSTKPG